jgi:hypothetical protein
MRNRNGLLRTILALGVAVLLTAGTKDALAVEQPKTVDQLGGDTTSELATSLRSLLVEAMPVPLFEDASHWGKQKSVARGLKWTGPDVHPEIQKSEKNDGRWWKVKVTADRPHETFALALGDLAKPEPGRMTFTVAITMPTQVELERQTWKAGVRLYSGSTRARLRVKLLLRCEAVTKLQNKGLLPEAVFRLRVLQAESGYDNLVVEHIAGVGGEAAKALGDTLLGILHQVHPSLERKLLAKADAAIVKAGDTKEVRLGLTSLFSKK